MDNKKYIDVYVERETEKAVYICDKSGCYKWLPKSQLVVVTFTKESGVKTDYIYMWLCPQWLGLKNCIYGNYETLENIQCIHKGVEQYKFFNYKDYVQGSEEEIEEIQIVEVKEINEEFEIDSHKLYRDLFIKESETVNSYKLLLTIQGKIINIAIEKGIKYDSYIHKFYKEFLYHLRGAYSINFYEEHSELTTARKIQCYEDFKNILDKIDMLKNNKCIMEKCLDF